jgi:hypothetical protein
VHLADVHPIRSFDPLFGHLSTATIVLPLTGAIETALSPSEAASYAFSTTLDRAFQSVINTHSPIISSRTHTSVCAVLSPNTSSLFFRICSTCRFGFSYQEACSSPLYGLYSLQDLVVFKFSASRFASFGDASIGRSGGASFLRAAR